MEDATLGHSEGLPLCWLDLHFDRGCIRVVSERGRETKTGRSRDVPMSPRLREALQGHAARYRFATYSAPDPLKFPALAAAIRDLPLPDRRPNRALLRPLYPEGMTAHLLQDRAGRRFRSLPMEERRRLSDLALATWRTVSASDCGSRAPGRALPGLVSGPLLVPPVLLQPRPRGGRAGALPRGMVTES